MTPPARTSLPRLVLVSTLGVVLVYYLWSASSSGNPFRFGDKATDYYNALSDALLAGQLSLLMTPDPDLLRLPDPYDPLKNRAYRIPYITHDLSLYDGRYYVYFGITPALALYIPFRAVFHAPLPENLALAALLFGCVVWSASTLRLLVKRFYAQTPFGILWLCLVLLSFSNFSPFILRRPATYEVAQASGAFFVLGGVYWLLRGIIGSKTQPLSLMAGSLFLGLAAGSRPTQVWSALFIPASYAAVLRVHYRHDWRRSWREALSLAIPLMTCLVGLFCYNRARFGSGLEFGHSYVLSEWNVVHAKLLSISNVPVNFVLHFFYPPRLDLEFPFFHVGPGAPMAVPPGYRMVESVGGLLPCAPLTALAFLWPLFLWKQRANDPAAPCWIGTVMLSVGLTIALFMCGYAEFTVRYLVDYCPLVLLAAALGWIHLDHLLARRSLTRRVFHGMAVLLLVYGTVLNLAIGLTGYYDWLKHRNGATYQRIEDWFVPAQRLFLSMTPRRYGDVRMRIRLPAWTPGEAQALVAAGGAYKHDVLCIRYLEGERALFKFHHRGDEPLRSRPVPLSPNQVYTLDVTLGSLYPVNARVLAQLYPESSDDEWTRRLSVRLDGNELMSGSFDFVPSSPSLVTFGRDLRTNGQCDSRFNGEILGIERSFPPR